MRKSKVLRSTVLIFANNVKNEKSCYFPGWNRNEKTYKKLIKLAPAGWKIYCLSYQKLIPFGNVKDLNEKVLEFLKEKNIEEASFLGVSLGGVLAIRFAIEHPKKIDRLFLVDSEGVYEGDSSVRALKNVAIKKDLLDSLKVLFTFFRNPILSFRTGRFAHYADIQEDAKKIKVPTTIIWGDKDKVTPIWRGERLHSLIPNSKFVTVPGEHDWIVYYPENFWSNI